MVTKRSINVRKHRAPKGALRPRSGRCMVRGCLASQKAPSAKRCIKTLTATKREVGVGCESESTERQKVH